MKNTALVSSTESALTEDLTLASMLKNCAYKVGIKLRRHILATHKELEILRSCSRLINSGSNHKVYIVAPAGNKQTDFITKTLIHFGVSCGRISVVSSGPGLQNSGTIYLLVGN
jgi:hypothetical protein